MRIGELAGTVGVSTDTVRFYERAGWLPSVARGENGYREYSAADAEHLRLLLDLRHLDIPLAVAADLARSCHTGHCDAMATALPSVIEAQRTAIADRVAGLQALDARLATLSTHLARQLPMAGDACCEAADAVTGECGCCVAATAARG